MRTQLANDKEATLDRQMDRIQDISRKTAVAVNQRGAPPLTTDNVTFTAGGQAKMNHKLGRVPVEWSAVDVTGGYGSFQRIAWDAKTITIQSQNACTASFRVA